MHSSKGRCVPALATRCTVAAACLLLSACAVDPPMRTVEPAALVLPYEWMGNIEESGFNEPSGLTYHPGPGTLFMVGDEGDIAELGTDGKILRQKALQAGRDLEGITLGPKAERLYVAVEGEEKILEVDPETFAVLREYEIPRFRGREEVFKEGGQGIEAICFVPDPGHPRGGTFFVANQSFTMEPGEERSLIVELELPPPGGGGRCRILNRFSPGVIDVAALHYHAGRGHLFAVSDAHNLLMEFTLDGRPVGSWSFTAANQEGLAMDEEGLFYIAQDHGGVIKIRPLWPDRH